MLLLQCEMELSSILGTYRDDFSEYRRRINSEILQLILDKAPGLIGRKLKYTEFSRAEKSGTSAEVDYLFEIDGKIIPVEVKSGTTGNLKSLHVFCSEKKTPLALRYNLGLPVISDVTSRISGKDEHLFRLLSLPLYMVLETRRLIQSMN